jgi:ketosteroid isomerase-like protein
MTITDNAASLTRLLDEAAVRDATARFAEAATSADYDGFRTLWADDAIWVIGAPKASPSRGAPRGQTTAGDPQTPVSQDDEVGY